MGLTMAQTAKSKSAREASLERRRALTTAGKAALTGENAASTSQNTKITTVMVNTPAQVSSMTGRAASRARRDAMSNNGKAGLAVNDRIRSATAMKTSSAVLQTEEQDVSSVQDKSTAGCGCGCNGTNAACNSKRTDLVATSKSRIIPNRKKQTVARSAARIASLARREATSSRGKAVIIANGTSAAQNVTSSKP